MTAELHQGDCLEWMKGQPDAIADLAILDPPYNIQSTRGGGPLAVMPGNTTRNSPRYPGDWIRISSRRSSAC